jgi:aubergine-like protein
MLIADVTHKVLRIGEFHRNFACNSLTFHIDTVLDYLYELTNTTKNWKELATKQLVGQIVLTRYNNRTYRIDDIAWELNPLSKFKKKNGDDITYLSYYSLSYNRTIKDTSQPLLVHRHRRKGASDEIIYLVPELCTMTGL